MKQFGGMKLINFRCKEYLLKISWVKILKEDEELAKLAYVQLDNVLKGDIWKANLKFNDISLVITREGFWTDVLKAWSMLNYINVIEPNEIAHQMLWYNSDIRKNNRPYFIKKAYMNGMSSISNLITPQGKQIPPDVICNWYEIDPLSYNSIWSAIPQDWKRVLITERFNPTFEYLCDKIQTQTNVSSWAYDILVAEEQGIFNLYVKWQTKLHTKLSYIDFQTLFKNVYKITNHSKYRSFQFRLLHNALVFNERLKLWKILEDDKCTYCDGKENVIHFYTECTVPKEFWLKIREFCKNEFDETISVRPVDILFNTTGKSVQSIGNFIILIAKTYMYAKRCLKEEYNMKGLINTISSCERSEFLFAMKNNKISKHYVKWHGLDSNEINPDTYTHEYLVDMLLYNLKCLKLPLIMKCN